MKSRLWLLASVLIGLPVYLWWLGRAAPADTGSGKAIASRVAPLAPQFVGAGSCAAAACHNGNFATGKAGSEYTIWITRDPHAKAFEVLFEERSARIQTNLDAGAPAHQDQRCLTCHVAPEFKPGLEKKAQNFQTDGVSCESCHGPAQKWLNVHHLPAWRQMTSAQKQSQGMRDTQTLLGRTRLCVTCHLGTPGMEVNHDLIAAGHPRLNFEFAAFHAFMPRHWPDPKDRDPAKSPRGRADFEVCAWVMGQLVTSQAALELLADRAGDRMKPWPEFAEHDCAACHHDLQSPSWRQQRGFAKRKPGAFPWGNHVSLTRRVLESLDNKDDPQLANLLGIIQKAMDLGNPNRQELAANARAAAALLKSWPQELEQKNLDPKWVDQLLQTMLSKDATKAIGSWDEFTQFHLGLAALHTARREMKMAALRADLGDALLNSASKLDLPTYPFDPEAMRARLSDFKRIGHAKVH